MGNQLGLWDTDYGGRFIFGRTLVFTSGARGFRSKGESVAAEEPSAEML